MIRSSRRPHAPAGKSWPMPAIVSSRAPGIARGGGGATGRMHHPVTVAVDDERRNVDLPEFGGAVPGCEDAGQLPSHASRRRVAIPGDARLVAHPLLVERESVRSDVAEHLHRAVDRLGPVSRRPRRRHPPPRRQRGTSDARRTGVRHDRRQGANPSRMVRGDRLGDHAAHRDADEVRVAVAEGVEQSDGVARHVAEVVLPRVTAAAQDRHRVRRGEVGVRRAAHVAVVEADHPVSALGERCGEFRRPGVLLLTQAGDQHDRRIRGVAESVVAQLDAATDVDDGLRSAVTPTPARRRRRRARRRRGSRR